MLGNTSDIRKETEQQNKDEACYGGFGGRLSYESRQTRASRILAKLAIGTAMCCFFGVLGTLCGVLMFHLVSNNQSLYYTNSSLPLLIPSDTEVEDDYKFTLDNVGSNISVIRNCAAVENVTEEMSSRYRVPTGVMIHELSETGSLYKAGVTQGDIIVGLDSIDVTDTDQLNKLLADSKGKTVCLSVFRNNSYVKLYASFE